MKQILLVAFVLAAFGTIAAQKRESVFEATKAVNDASLRGHVERDVEKIVAAYAPDAIVLPPGGVEPLRGLAAIRDYYAKGFDGGRVLRVTTENLSFEALDARRAVEVGRYTMLYRAAGADRDTVIKGTMVIQWEKNKRGEWKIKLDMWH